MKKIQNEKKQKNKKNKSLENNAPSSSSYRMNHGAKASAWPALACAVLRTLGWSGENGRSVAA